MKIKMTRFPAEGGGFVSDKREVKVLTWDANQTLPQNAEPVPDETPESDWHEETL